MANDRPPSFQVTESAKRQLNAVAQQRGLDPGRFLRLALPPVWTGEGDFGIVIDSRGAADVDISYKGRPVLLIEQEMAERLAASVLDFKEPPEGPRFTLDVY
jgi:hypothetical protein